MVHRPTGMHYCLDVVGSQSSAVTATAGSLVSTYPKRATLRRKGDRADISNMHHQRPSRPSPVLDALIDRIYGRRLRIDAHD